MTLIVVNTYKPNKVIRSRAFRDGHTTVDGKAIYMTGADQAHAYIKDRQEAGYTTTMKEITT